MTESNGLTNFMFVQFQLYCFPLSGANGKAIEETVDESSFELDVQDILQKRGIVSTMTISGNHGSLG